MSELIIIRQALNEFTITYPEGTDLTGKSAAIDFKKLTVKANPVLSLTSDDGLDINIPDRKIIATITTAQSEALKVGTYIADVALIEAGEVTRSPIFKAKVIDYVTDAA